MSKPLPWYFTVNDRPVQMISTPDGGMDVLALNMRTGQFERATEYLSKCLVPGGDVQELSEADFTQRVAAIRAALSQQPVGSEVHKQ